MESRSEMSKWSQSTFRTGSSDSMKSQGAQSSHSKTTKSQARLVEPVLKPQKIVFGNIISPYNAAVTRCWNMKLNSKRVFVPWYRRYADILPEGQQSYFQPYAEIQRRDEDIALQHYYGDDYREVCRGLNLKDCGMKRKATLRQYNKWKAKVEAKADEARNGRKESQETPERRKSVRSIVFANKTRSVDYKAAFGPTEHEIQVLEPVVAYFNKLHLKRIRYVRGPTFLDEGSKWALFQDPSFTEKVKIMAIAKRKRERRAKFRRLIGLVRCLRRFINILSTIAGDPKLLFKMEKSQNQKSAPETPRSKRESEVYETKDRMKLKYVFDVEKYKLSEKRGISLDVRLILSKPFFKRSDEDVKKVVQSLQRVRYFVEYPPTFQYNLARVAWLVEVPKNKLIIRQRHQAVDLYFLVAGRAKADKLIGNPDINQRSEFQDMGTLCSGESFGEECMLDPYCDREYSVLSQTFCQLISINIDDFTNMILRRQMNEEAPEHIRYLCNLAILDGFPKHKLLTKAENNIYMFYFREGTLMVSDLKKSKYIYVVRQGTCSILTEIKPPPGIIAKYKTSEAAKRMVSTRKNPTLHEMSVSSVMNDFKKELAVKTEASQRGARSMVTTLFRDAGMEDVLLKDLEKRSVDIERYKSIITAESRAIHEKSLKLSKTLPKSHELRISSANRLSVISQTPENPSSRYSQLGDKGSTLPKLSSLSKINELKKNSQVPDSPQGNDKQEAGRTLSDVPSRSRKSSAVAQTNSKEKLDAISEAGDFEENRRITFTVDESSQKRSNRSTIVGSQIDIVSATLGLIGWKSPDDKGSRRNTFDLKEETESNSTKGDEKMDAVSQLSPSSSADSSSDKPVKRKRAFAERKKRLENSKNAIEYSRWKFECLLTSGDTAGTEYLDFNSGPYLPPSEKRSLVSNGATVITIRRDFMLRYLKKE